MKTRVIIIGLVLVSVASGTFVYYVQLQVECANDPRVLHNPKHPQLDCLEYLRMIEPITESFIESGPIEITGVINHWQPIDGPAYALITDDQPIDAKVSNLGIFLYGEMLQPHMKDKTVTIKGTFVPNYVEYKTSLGLRLFGGDPSTATILVDEIKINSD